ncbi:MAG: rhodanese-like domain-containing protein [Pyrinomonadaceae bacterium]
MNCKKWASFLFVLVVISMAQVSAGAGMNPRQSLGLLQAQSTLAAIPAAEFISTEELKAKLARNEPVTIIDVRGTSSFADSDNTIKGSIHVKLRRLKSRLAFPPLKRVPRDGEVVTYCACPSDESAVDAARILAHAGFKRVRVLKGGWRMWLAAKGPIVSRPKAN